MLLQPPSRSMRERNWVTVDRGVEQPGGRDPLEVVAADRLGAAEGLAEVARVGQQQAVAAPEPCSCSAPPSA